VSRQCEDAPVHQDRKKEIDENPFDSLAERYDGWFDSPDGKIIFEAEVECLRLVMEEPAGRWLEVGVGTGRFAAALGIREGIDPSSEMLKRARERGIRTRVGYGEKLPYSDATFDGVILVVTICFLDEPTSALKECARVLKNRGALVVGLVPAESPWGEGYARKGAEGHPFYSKAKFYTAEKVISMAAEAGFIFQAAASTLFESPEEELRSVGLPRKGIIPGAGFLAIRFSLK